MKRPNKFTTERFCLRVEHAAATADTSIEVLSASRKMRIDRVAYHNATGLTDDASNFFALSALKNPGVDDDVVASWSTETGEEGAIAAATWVELTDGDAVDMVLDAGDALGLLLDETGTQTLPAGTFLIEGQYL